MWVWGAARAPHVGVEVVKTLCVGVGAAKAPGVGMESSGDTVCVGVEGSEGST